MICTTTPKTSSKVVQPRGPLLLTIGKNLHLDDRLDLAATTVVRRPSGLIVRPDHVRSRLSVHRSRLSVHDRSLPSDDNHLTRRSVSRNHLNTKRRTIANRPRHFSKKSTSNTKLQIEIRAFSYGFLKYFNIQFFWMGFPDRKIGIKNTIVFANVNFFEYIMIFQFFQINKLSHI